MRKSDVAVVDYGVGNLLSVQRALEHCGAAAIVTSEPERILAASHVVLPGVGAFENGIGSLRRNGLDEVVIDVVKRGTWLLGICLGMQMLLDSSQEFGHSAGLGLIPGEVVPIPAVASDGGKLKVPHVGWSPLVGTPTVDTWQGTLLQDARPNDAAYFVHSFMANPMNSRDRISDCLYGGHRLTAVVQSGNVSGTQFHPEKSGDVGLRVLRKFLALK